MKPIAPKNLTGTQIYVKPFRLKTKGESSLILPNETGDMSDKSAKEITPWFEITRKGAEVTNYDVGDVVMISPMVFARQNEPFDFGKKDDDDNRVWEFRLDVSNILGEADLSKDLEV